MKADDVERWNIISMFFMKSYRDRLGYVNGLQCNLLVQLNGTEIDREREWRSKNKSLFLWIFPNFILSIIAIRSVFVFGDEKNEQQQMKWKFQFKITLESL